MDRFDEKGRRIKYMEIIRDFLAKRPNPTEDDIYYFMINNEWKISSEYEKDCHREDILSELEELDYNIKAIPNELIDNILYFFEEKISDYGSEMGWRDILDNAIDEYEEDLEEYKVEEN